MEWRVIREDADDLASPRYFKAFGRDVDVAEVHLSYDTSCRWLTVAGGTRSEARAAEAVRLALPLVLDFVARNPGPNRGTVEDAFAGGPSRRVIRATLGKGVADKALICAKGQKNACCYWWWRRERGCSPVRRLFAAAVGDLPKACSSEFACSPAPIQVLANRRTDCAIWLERSANER